MTIREYKESQARAAKMIELYNADQVAGKRAAIKSWSNVIDRINAAIDKESKSKSSRKH